jgi:hypothetical protein
VFLFDACADEIDAVGTKRYDSTSGGEREIQRTMLELLNQMDGFDARGDVKARRGGLLPCMQCFELRTHTLYVFVHALMVHDLIFAHARARSHR